MIIFKNDNTSYNRVIGKYEITFKEKQLLNLRQLIIDNCSFIEHKEAVLSDYEIGFFYDEDTIRNFKKGYIVGDREYFEATDYETFFICYYDKYTYSKLVSLIDKLLNDDQSVINELDNYFNGEIINHDLDNMDKELSLLSYKIDNIDNSLSEEKTNMIKEYNALLNKYNKLSKIQENETRYLTVLKKLINYNFLGYLRNDSIIELNNILEFFGDINNLCEYVKENNDYISQGNTKKLERK